MTWAGPNWKPAKGSGRLARRARRADDAKLLQDAYDEVDRRHGPFCAATGVRFRFDSPDPRFTRHHHHLKGRRVRPDWVFRPERIIPVTSEVHDLIEGGFIVVEGNDARRPMFFFWDEEQLRLYKKKKPFRLLGKRTVAA